MFFKQAVNKKDTQLDVLFKIYKSRRSYGIVEVKGFCPRDYMKLLTGFPLYFHDTIIPHDTGTLGDIFT